MDADSTLKWLLSQVGSDSIEEVTGTMMEKLIKETKHLVVLFCKYIGYAIIALTHTCFLLKNYTTSRDYNVQHPAAANGQVQNGVARPISPRPSSNLNPNINHPRPISPIITPPTYLPPDKVKGLSMEM